MIQLDKEDVMTDQQIPAYSWLVTFVGLHELYLGHGHGSMRTSILQMPHCATEQRGEQYAQGDDLSFLLSSGLR